LQQRLVLHTRAAIGWETVDHHDRTARPQAQAEAQYLLIANEQSPAGRLEAIGWFLGQQIHDQVI